jgi:hypothetical protein
MRTTLTLESDVARRLGLAGKAARPKHFEVRPHSFGFKPGIDLDRINQLADELDSEETARKSSL